MYEYGVQATRYAVRDDPEFDSMEYISTQISSTKHHMEDKTSHGADWLPHLTTSTQQIWPEYSSSVAWCRSWLFDYCLQIHAAAKSVMRTWIWDGFRLCKPPYSVVLDVLLEGNDEIDSD